MVEQILRKASFKGAEFHIADHSAEIGGRRATVHEYAGRNLSYPEDMGGKARSFSINAYVLGSDYQEKRNALIKACNSTGAGELVHPYLGTLNVLCTACTVSESSQEGRIANFTLSFALSQEKEVAITRVNTREKTTQKRFVFEQKTQDAFYKKYTQESVESLPSWQKDKLNATLKSINETLGMANDSIETTPEGVFNQISRKIKYIPYVSEVLSILEKVEAISNKVNSDPIMRDSEALNLSNSVLDATRAELISQGVGNATDTDFSSASEALDTFEKLDDYIEKEYETVSKNQEDEVFTALQDVRASFVEHIKTTATQLPEVEKISVQETMPSLRIAFENTGFAIHAEAFDARNNIANPCFVKGGKQYEILKEEDNE